MLTFRQITKISTRGVERNYACVGEELRFSPEHANKLMVVAHALSVSSETDPDSFYTSFVECRKFFTKNRNDGVIGCSFEKPVFREGEHEGGFCVFVFSGNENKGVLMGVDIDDELYKEGEKIYNTIMENIEEYHMKKDYRFIDEILCSIFGNEV